MGLIIDDCMSFENIQNMDTTIAIVGIKTGDINFSAQPRTFVDTTDLLPNPLIFKTYDRTFASNDTFNITFTSSNFTQIAGYQHTIKYDPNVLEVIDYSENEHPAFQTVFGDTNNLEGILNIMGLTTYALYGFADASP